jgi:ParB-like chromosome segregation protein Spo0J
MTKIHVARDLKVVPIESLKPYERNARTHSKEQVAQIAASLKEFGFTNPILIDGSRGIIAGHGRLAAAKSIGLTEVPVVELGHLTPSQKRAYILADNKIAMNAGWDVDLLASELAALGGELENFDAIGFSDDEISNILAGFDEDLATGPVEITREAYQEPEPEKKATTLNNVIENPVESSHEVASEHWVGMPEFKQDDKTGVRHVIVHFPTHEDCNKFFALIGQNDTGQTKTVWFPPQERMDTESKRYGE